MHPNAYLRTFWRMELRPTVFVAMSFADTYQDRYERVIRAAIEDEQLCGLGLTAHRVDVAKSGDSILTDIVDGIAHARLVLADVSVVGNDSRTGRAYRNGNVLYEVGVALSCRLPGDVLLIRDDHERFLFDLSTIPHMTLDFTSPSAIGELRRHLADRIRTQQMAQDARIEMAVRTLTPTEVQALLRLLEIAVTGHMRWTVDGTVTSALETALARLLDKGLIYNTDIHAPRTSGFKLTPMGRVAAELVRGAAGASGAFRDQTSPGSAGRAGPG